MASLSEEMKNKRDIKRKAEILIVDKDFGNFGLYKAILSVEHILECAYNIDIAMELCKHRRFDIVIIEGDMGIENFKNVHEQLKGIYVENTPIMLVIADSNNKEEIIHYLCAGAEGYISKPFTKENMSEVVRTVLQARRKKETKNTVAIIDNDFAQLKSMKNMLDKRYSVNIINDVDVARDFVAKKKPNLVIMDVDVIKHTEMEKCDVIAKENADRHVLFLSKEPNEEIISKCSKFNPEGILIKPFAEEVFTQTVEKILFRHSYMDDFGKV